MNSVVMSHERGSRNETLLVRRMAASINPILAEVQAKRRTSRLQKDIQRQLKNRSDEHSLQVFIRLMQANRYTDDELIRNNRQQPPTPPASPVPFDDHNDETDDFTINVPELDVSSLKRDKSAYKASALKKPLTVNTWMGNTATHNDSWLVMRGRNIRLQHQEHVKNALLGHRAIQSALPRCNANTHPSGAFSPGLLFNGKKGSQTPSPDSNRNRSYDLKPLGCRSNYKPAAARSRHSATARPMTSLPDGRPGNRTPVSTKSIVIRMPDSSRTSP